MQRLEIGTIVRIPREHEHYGMAIYGQCQDLMISRVIGTHGGGFYYELLRADGTDPTRYDLRYRNAISQEDVVVDVFLNAVRKAIQCSHSK